MNANVAAPPSNAYLCFVPINVQRFRRILVPQVDRFKVVEVGLIQVDGIILEDGVLTCLDHAFHLGQVGFVLLLLLTVTRGLFFIESIDVLWPATLDVGDADVGEARVVGKDVLASDVNAILRLVVHGRRHSELLLVSRFVARDVDDQLIVVLFVKILKTLRKHQRIELAWNFGMLRLLRLIVTRLSYVAVGIRNRLWVTTQEGVDQLAFGKR